MIREIEIIKLLTSVEKDGKIIRLYYEDELPPVGILYQTFGKENISTKKLKIKKNIEVVSEKELHRRIGLKIRNT